MDHRLHFNQISLIPGIYEGTLAAKEEAALSQKFLAKAESRFGNSVSISGTDHDLAPA